MQAAHQKTEQIRQAINCEDYKKAIKLSSKIADKSDLAKVMQAYALERLGRRDGTNRKSKIKNHFRNKGVEGANNRTRCIKGVI